MSFPRTRESIFLASKRGSLPRSKWIRFKVKKWAPAFAGVTVPAVTFAGVTVPAVAFAGVTVPAVTFAGMTVPAVTFAGVTVPAVTFAGVTVPAVTFAGMTVSHALRLHQCATKRSPHLRGYDDN